MSSIPYSFFVNFTSSKIKVSSSISRLNAIVITKPNRICNEFMSFNDTNSMLTTYAIDSAEYEYANNFFSFQNKNGNFAEVINFYNFYENDTPASLQGKKVFLDKLKKNGSFGITIGSRTEQIAVDLTSKVSLTDIATEIQSKINELGNAIVEETSPEAETPSATEAENENQNDTLVAPTTSTVIRDEDPAFKNATFVFDSVTGGFTLNSGFKGESSSIGFMTSGVTDADLSQFLNMRAIDGATIVNGMNGKSFQDALNSIVSSNGDYYSIAANFELTDDDIEIFAKTISNTKCRFLSVISKYDKRFVGIDNPLEHLIGYEGVAVNFNPTENINLNPITQAFIASLDLSRTDSVVSMNFIPATKYDSENTISDSQSLNNLNKNRINGIFSVGDFGERNVFYGEGRIFGDMFKNIDSYVWNSFIKFNIEKAMFFQIANSNIIGARSNNDIQLLIDTAINQCENFVSAGMIVANPILTNNEQLALQKMLKGNQDSYNSCINNGYVFQFLRNIENADGSVTSEFNMIYIMNIATSRIKISAMFI